MYRSKRKRCYSLRLGTIMLNHPAYLMMYRIKCYKGRLQLKQLAVDLLQ